MFHAVEPVTSTLDSLTTHYRVITNNLANVSTNGFKREIATFERTMDVQPAEASDIPGSERIGHDIRPKISIDPSQGAFQRTGRPLDFAISGPGMFTVESPDGPVYTRNGSFRCNAEGVLVDGSGRKVAGESGDIRISIETAGDDISVGKNGVIYAGGKEIGKLKLVKLPDQGDLIPVGHGCYRIKNGATPIQDTNEVHVEQGYQEKSNVNAINELINLIQITRLYEAGVKSISRHDEKVNEAIRVISK